LVEATRQAFHKTFSAGFSPVFTSFHEFSRVFTRSEQKCLSSIGIQATPTTTPNPFLTIEEFCRDGDGDTDIDI